MVETFDELIAYKKRIEDDIISARYTLGELPPSRETSLVRTKLDEALLWLGEVSDDIPMSD